MNKEYYQIINRCSHGYSAGIGLLIPEVLTLAGIETVNPVVIDDWDLRGTHIRVDDTVYYIRTWDIHEDKRRRIATVTWTLFRHRDDGKSDRLLAAGHSFRFKDLEAEYHRYEQSQNQS